MFAGRKLLTAVCVLTVLVPIAFARIVSNTIDDTATIRPNGRHVLVSGPVSCTAGETLDLRVTVTQRTTGAFGEGQTRLRCTGTDLHWFVEASTRGGESFEEGPATVTAIGITTSRGSSTDAHQWRVDITLGRQ